jgi:hypothetical protein
VVDETTQDCERGEEVERWRLRGVLLEDPRLVGEGAILDIRKVSVYG